MIQIRTVAFSFVVRQYAFPTVVFSDEEFTTRWKADYEIIKMYLNSILKSSFLCVKTLQPITTVVINNTTRQ